MVVKGNADVLVVGLASGAEKNSPSPVPRPVGPSAAKSLVPSSTIGRERFTLLPVGDFVMTLQLMPSFLCRIPSPLAT
jgi:hypothetical protein